MTSEGRRNGADGALRSAARAEMIDELLSRGESVRFTTIGTSMRWLIPPSSEIRARGCRAEDLRIGDVVVVRTPTARSARYGAHRVVGLERRGGTVRITTKGDSSPRDAKPVTRGDCVGRVYLVETPDGAFRLDLPVWRPLGAAAARLSALSGWIKARAPAALLRLRPPGRTIFPQTLVHSVIKRIIGIGRLLSRVPRPPAVR